MLTREKKKNVQFFESSNQIYVSDFIGLQRTERAQVVYYNKAVSLEMCSDPINIRDL